MEEDGEKKEVASDVATEKIGREVVVEIILWDGVKRRWPLEKMKEEATRAGDEDQREGRRVVAREGRGRLVGGRYV